MLYSYSNYLLLLEGKREIQLRAKYIDKLGIDEETFNKFYANKNAEWLLKTYSTISQEKKDEINNKGGRTLEDLLIKYAEMFDNNKDNFDIKQISKIHSIDEMREILDSLRDFDNAEEDYGDDIWVLDNSYEWFIFKAYTYEASELANNKLRESNWCTTYAENHFKDYLGPEGGLIYICNKLDKTKDIAIEKSTDKYNIWDWEDSNIKSDYSFEEVIKKTWSEHEEPYNILMKNISKLDEDFPNINWDQARENAKYEYENMSISEIVDIYGTYTLFKYVDDDKFLDEIKDGEYERWYEDWKYESDLLEMTMVILKNDFNEWTDDNKKTFFETFEDEMKEVNNDNESSKGDSDYYDWENHDLYEYIRYIEDSYSDEEGEEIIKKIGLEHEIIEKCVDNYMNNFSGAEDYLTNIYGNNITGQEISYYISPRLVDMDGLVEELVDEMDEEQLRYYIN